MIPRYTTPEMAELWSEHAKYQSWLDVELAACDGWARLGRIPAEAASDIRARAKFDAERIEEIEREVQHDVIAFTTNLAEHIGENSRFVHLGLTSSDVVDTALALRLNQAGAMIGREMRAVHARLRELALEYRRTPIIGRTHGVHGEPTTLGLKFLIFDQEFDRNRERLEVAFAGIAVGKISGAVGTYAHTGPELEKMVCEQLGLAADPISSQIVQRDRHAALACALAVAAGTIEKLALEIRHLQRTEVRELEEPFAKGQKGSSAMPHKRNPVKCEQLCGLARLLRGYALAALENQALWHERDISHSSAERVLFADATTLLHYMLRQILRVLNGLHIYPERMAANLNLTRGLLYSQLVLLTLVEKGLSRETAYAIVQHAAMKTWDDPGASLRRELLKDESVRGHLSEQEIDELMTPERFLAYVDAIYRQCGVPEAGA